MSSSSSKKKGKGFSKPNIETFAYMAAAGQVPFTIGTVTITNTTQLTVGAAGSASALPATPSGYLEVPIGGTNYVIPYYKQS